MSMCPFTCRRQAVFVMVFSSVCLTTLGGCGPSTGEVSGKVMYKDQVVKGGIVMFVAEGKPSGQSPIAEDGSYSVKDAPTGSVKVVVDTSSLNPKSVSPMAKYSPPKDQKAPDSFGSGGPDRKEMERRYVEIPERYRDPSKTTVTTTVTGGKQTYDIKLEP